MNAKLKESQKQEGLAGMGKLFGENLGAESKNLGETSEAVKARTGAASQNWDWARYLLDPTIEAGGRVAAAMMGGGGGP
jgi:uncharacterized protein YfaA (DUF2138 family)